MSKFQLVLTGIFVFFVVIGVIVFAMYRGGSENAVRVVVWGTIPQTTFNTIIQDTALYQSKDYIVQYVEKTAENFDGDFVEALASGVGPDLFILDSDKIVTHRNKIFPIPYNILTQRQFRDSFIEGSEIFMVPEGIIALPVLVDPLVMYWNRDIFTQALLTRPPSFWDEFYNLANVVSIKDGSLNILRSAVALGEFANISNAKEIVLNLTMQAGSPVTAWGPQGIMSVYNANYNKTIPPAESAINFYTEFSNPSKSTYSWNRSLPNSTNYFLSGDLAVYFGFASEIRNIQIRNPNLNFDVVGIPTIREGGSNVSYAKYLGFAITNASVDKNSAFNVALILSDSVIGRKFSENTRLAPARRDLLNERQTDPYKEIFYNSAIRSKGWLDPSPQRTNILFRDMVESITSGRSRTAEAINRANTEINNLLGR